MERIGERLKKIRLQKGLTLEEVHKKTKIHLSILKAIEENQTIDLSPVYLKGFLKIYGKFLGLDPEDYLANYHLPEEGVKIIPGGSALDTRHTPPMFLRTTYGKLRLLCGLKIKRIILSIVLAFFLFACLFALGKFISSRINLTKKPHERQKVENIPPQAIPSVIRLSLRAKEDCWVSVKIDGRLVFRNILKKGKFETWQAKERIDFSLGNAGGVDIELNNKVIPPLGRKGQVLKNIVITKEEGLRVPQ
ncbi:MAG: DUF4115 domain-containing protein [Candidatus Omnitrophica bacterium]|nr:DUF4115 domain-containing protein [Candidatus Omnitrophota bacterium]